jgi:hypothetical protein
VCDATRYPGFKTRQASRRRAARKIIIRPSQDDAYSYCARPLLYQAYTMAHCVTRSHFVPEQNKITYGADNSTGLPAATPVYQTCPSQHQKINSGCQDHYALFSNFFLLHLTTLSKHILKCTPPKKGRSWFTLLETVRINSNPLCRHPPKGTDKNRKTCQHIPRTRRESNQRPLKHR